MNKINLAILLLLCFAKIGFSQPTDNAPSMTEEEKYAWRIRQAVLFDVYIPKDVNEVLLELNKKMDAPSKAKFAALTEEEASSKLFFSLGRWMTHNWSLFEGSRLSKYLQDMGIHHPDNMVRFLITVYHRSLNKKPLEVKQLIQSFQALEAQEKQKRLGKGTILHEEKKKTEKPKGN